MSERKVNMAPASSQISRYQQMSNTHFMGMADGQFPQQPEGKKLPHKLNMI